MVTLPRLGSVRGTTLRPTPAQGKSTRRMRTLPSCASSESSDAAASSEIPSRRPIWAGATGPCPSSDSEDLALEVAPPIVHAARPLHGAGVEQQPCPPRAPGISGGCGGGGPGAAPPPPHPRGGGPPLSQGGIIKARPP